MYHGGTNQATLRLAMRILAHLRVPAAGEPETLQNKVQAMIQKLIQMPMRWILLALANTEDWSVLLARH